MKTDFVYLDIITYLHHTVHYNYVPFPHAVFAVCGLSFSGSFPDVCVWHYNACAVLI